LLPVRGGHGLPRNKEERATKENMTIKIGGLTAKPQSQPSQGNKTRSSVLQGSKKGLSYRPLKTQFRKGGFDYRQIMREGDVAIFEQRWGKSPNVCYEVVRIRRHDGFHKGGVFIEPAEMYPRSEEWGVHGWTVLTRDAAFDKLREIGGSDEQRSE
jgi:hypothetical protein